MAQSITITVSDAQATRFRTALGHYRMVNGFVTNEWVLATAQEVQAWVLQQAKNHTIAYEAGQARVVDEATRRAEVW